MTRHTLNGRLLQYTIAPEFRGNWRMRKRLKPGSLFLPRNPGYEASSVGNTILVIAIAIIASICMTYTSTIIDLQ